MKMRNCKYSKYSFTFLFISILVRFRTLELFMFLFLPVHIYFISVFSACSVFNHPAWPDSDVFVSLIALRSR